MKYEYQLISGRKGIIECTSNWKNIVTDVGTWKDNKGRIIFINNIESLIGVQLEKR